MLAVGGPDLGPGWAGSYADEDGASEAIRARGGDLERVIEGVARQHGLAEVEPRLARRGDLLVCRDRMLIGGMALAAICEGRDAVSTTLRGLIRLPMRVAIRAWAVD